MKGCLIALAYVSVWYIAKAILEGLCFKDRIGARKTLRLWLISSGSIGLALGFSLVLDYFG